MPETSRLRIRNRRRLKLESANAESSLSPKELAIRTQYHFRPSPVGLRAWSVDRLVEMSRDLPREMIPLSAIRELDETFWGPDDGRQMTCREVANHARLIRDCDLKFPIILSKDGRVMDGMHRVAKALIEGREAIEAVRFEHDPEPDYVGVSPDNLPYPNSE
jgi:hypothetical protein